MSPARLHAKQEHEHDQKPLKFTPDANKTQTPPPPPPVIIYTHSPKVIHTHPRDFRSLVQKLTGYTPPPLEVDTRATHDHNHQEQGNMDDNESSSVVTDDHCTSVNDVPQVNSCLTTDAGFDPYFNPTPFFPANPSNFLCAPTHQLPSFYAPDSRLFNRNSMSSSSSSSLRVLREYQDI